MDAIENYVSSNSTYVACVFVAAVTFLLSRCLATIRGIYIYMYTATVGRGARAG
jgi:hypothetical protein